MVLMNGSPFHIADVATEAFDVLDTGRQISSFSARLPDFSLANAYQVTADVRQLREARGETPIGRKIGFTNRITWPDYAPMWGYVYDHTVHELADTGYAFGLTGTAEPRIEPEIVFRLAAAPTTGMDERALLASVDAVTLGFEVVQSIFPRWTFTAPDAVAAFGLHAALLLGQWQPVRGQEDAWQKSLVTFTVDLLRGESLVERGRASNVLDGPLKALRHLVDLLARDPVNPPLAAGEIITTGTLTAVPPVAAQQRWSTRLVGAALPDISVVFE
jgi:2-oxo-3-hexenedioate decarboxylase